MVIDIVTRCLQDVRGKLKIQFAPMSAIYIGRILHNSIVSRIWVVAFPEGGEHIYVNKVPPPPPANAHTFFNVMSKIHRFHFSYCHSTSLLIINRPPSVGFNM